MEVVTWTQDGHARALAATEQEEFELASKIAQIFSGALFSALVAYLVFSNSTRLSYIQKASLEKRLNVCCQLNTIVASFSAFLNYFQLTEVDNWMLPGGRTMVVDVARPIEWIMTCPLMQLSLVIMGGSRIPEYRRVVMPTLAAVTLLFGSATLFVEEPYVFILYGCGLMNHSVAMYLNWRQIQEHSKNVEGLLEGDSEFRKATLILMATWLPFPIWYILSPEGLGYVTNIAVIQMGWAFLNIISKFSLIFYMQRIKDNYCNRLKVKREMKGALQNAYAADDDSNHEEDIDTRKLNGELSACVVETMSDLGMAYNVERFLTLLKEAKIYSLQSLEKLSPEDCTRLSLPHDLVAALQKRLKVWALEMVDDAEKGIEDGERHYKVSKGSTSNKATKARVDGGSGQLFLAPSNVVPTSPMGFDPQNSFTGFADNSNGFSSEVCGTSPTPTRQISDHSGMVPMGAPVSPMGAPMNMGFANGANGFQYANAPNGGMQYPTPGMLPQSNGQYGMQSPGFGRPLSAELVKPQRRDSESDTLKNQAINVEGMKDNMTEAVKPLEKRLEQFEHKMLDRFELVIDNLSRKMEKQMEKQTVTLQEKFGSGLQDVRSSMERSQSMFEAKIEFLVSSQQKELSSNQSGQAQQAGQVMQQYMQAENNNNEQIKRELRDLAESMEKMSLRASMAASDGTNTNVQAAHAVEQSLELVTKKMEDFQEVQKSALSRLGGSITQMMDGWAQHTVQESKAAAFTLQTKMAQLEESQNKKVSDLEQNITYRLQQLMGESIESVRASVTEQTKASSQQLQASIDSTRTMGESESSRIEQKLNEFVKNLNTDFSRNVEVGLGVVGNSLRSQLEGLQASQLSQHHNTEASISNKVESKLDRVQQSLLQQSQQLASQSVAQSQKNLEKHTESITGILKQTREDVQKVSRAAEDMSNTAGVMQDVRAGTDECVERLTVLHEHLGVDESTRPAGGPGGPGGRRMSNSGRGEERGFSPRKSQNWNR